MVQGKAPILLRCPTRDTFLGELGRTAAEQDFRPQGGHSAESECRSQNNLLRASNPRCASSLDSLWCRPNVGGRMQWSHAAARRAWLSGLGLSRSSSSRRRARLCRRRRQFAKRSRGGTEDAVLAAADSGFGELATSGCRLFLARGRARLRCGGADGRSQPTRSGCNDCGPAARRDPSAARADAGSGEVATGVPGTGHRRSGCSDRELAQVTSCLHDAEIVVSAATGRAGFRSTRPGGLSR